METLDLAYVGRGVHEELVAYVADQEGFFEQEGVHVAVRDGVGWDEQRLRRGATIGLGRAMLSRLTQGVPWMVLSVNTHRPLFWFLAREATSVAELRGARLLVHPAHTAPGCFARIVLRRHGLDPDSDLTCLTRSPGDYARDLRRLRAGEADAAYVGSTLAPEQVAAEEGWQVLAWVGDHFAIPTVGVAVDPTHLDPASPAVTAAVRANRRALRLLAEDPDRATAYLRAFLGRLTDHEARAYHARYIAGHFSADGAVDPDSAQHAVTAVASELDVADPPPAAQIYRTDLVPAPG